MKRRDFIKGSAVLASSVYLPGFLGTAASAASTGNLVVKVEGESPYALVKKAVEVLGGMDEFTEEGLENELRKLTEDMGVGFGKLAQPLRVALTGSSASPGIFEVLQYLGKERTLKRIQYALDNLV